MSKKENIAYNVEDVEDVEDNEDEKWDNGELGCDERYVKVADKKVEDALEQALKR